MPTAPLNLHAETIRALPQLGDLPLSEAMLLARLSTLRAFTPHTHIPIANLRLRNCYIIVDGTAHTVVLDREGKQISVGELHAGDFFGHSMLFSNRTLLYELRTIRRLYALQLSVEKLREHHAQLPTFMGLLEDSYVRRRALSTLSRVPLFATLPIESRQMLAEHLTRQTFERNTVIFEQGSIGKALYLIEQGQITVEQDGIIIATLSEGDFFGEMALFGQTTHNATIRTVTSVKCLQLPGDEFAKLVRSDDLLEEGVRKVIDSRIQHAQHVHSNEQQQHFLQVAVRHGILRGSHVLARRPDLCPPDCRICEQACAERFGQSRIKLNGVQLDDWDVTTSCRQCREGAECVEACPENAIVWDSHQQAFKVTDDCTGCSACFTACPYGAVEPQTIMLTERNSMIWQWWQRLLTNRTQVQTRTLASKCDLCAGYDNQACLMQCPTGSLQLIPVEDLFP